MHALNPEHAFTTLFNLFLSLTDEPICFLFFIFYYYFFSVKPSVLLYSDGKPRACQKLENDPWVGKFRARRLTRRANAPQ